MHAVVEIFVLINYFTSTYFKSVKVKLYLFLDDYFSN